MIFSNPNLKQITLYFLIGVFLFFVSDFQFFPIIVFFILLGLLFFKFEKFFKLIIVLCFVWPSGYDLNFSYVNHSVSYFSIFNSKFVFSMFGILLALAVLKVIFSKRLSIIKFIPAFIFFSFFTFYSLFKLDFSSSIAVESFTSHFFLFFGLFAGVILSDHFKNVEIFNLIINASVAKVVLTFFVFIIMVIVKQEYLPNQYIPQSYDSIEIIFILVIPLVYLNRLKPWLVILLLISPLTLLPLTTRLITYALAISLTLYLINFKKLIKIGFLVFLSWIVLMPLVSNSKYLEIRMNKFVNITAYLFDGDDLEGSSGSVRKEQTNAIILYFNNNPFEIIFGSGYGGIFSFNSKFDLGAAAYNESSINSNKYGNTHIPILTYLFKIGIIGLICLFFYFSNVFLIQDKRFVRFAFFFILLLGLFSIKAFFIAGVFHQISLCHGTVRSFK